MYLLECFNKKYFIAIQFYQNYRVHSCGHNEGLQGLSLNVLSTLQDSWFWRWFLNKETGKDPFYSFTLILEWHSPDLVFLEGFPQKRFFFKTMMSQIFFRSKITLVIRSKRRSRVWCAIVIDALDFCACARTWAKEESPVPGMEGGRKFRTGDKSRIGVRRKISSNPILVGTATKATTATTATTKATTAPKKQTLINQVIDFRSSHFVKSDSKPPKSPKWFASKTPWPPPTARTPSRTRIPDPDPDFRSSRFFTAITILRPSWTPTSTSSWLRYKQHNFFFLQK